jgi:hypothetical protein
MKYSFAKFKEENQHIVKLTPEEAEARRDKIQNIKENISQNINLIATGDYYDINETIEDLNKKQKELLDLMFIENITSKPLPIICAARPESTYETPFTHECNLPMYLKPKDDETIEYFIKCRDEKGNKNEQSTKLSLIGTKGLSIKNIKPQGEQVGYKIVNDISIEAKTKGGRFDSTHNCTLITPTFEELIKMENIGEDEFENQVHTIPLKLLRGFYRYGVLCNDDIGNVNVSLFNFSLVKDKYGPEIKYVYKVGDKIYTELYDVDKCFEYKNGKWVLIESSANNIVMVDSESQNKLSCKDISNLRVTFNLTNMEGS